MSHSFYNIWLHIVFSTKSRSKFIKTEIEEQIYDYISKQLQEMGCKTKMINGTSDHLHILISLNPIKSISEIVKQIIGSSSHWINSNNIISYKFAWQTGYSAFSVSESQLEKVISYIKNQKLHHAKKSFSDEMQEFRRVHGQGFNVT